MGTAISLRSWGGNLARFPPYRTRFVQRTGRGWRSAQCLQQRLGIFQIRRVKAFGEPIVDRGEQIAGLLGLALLLPEAGETRSGAQFPRFGLLFLSNRDGLLETFFSFSLTVEP